MGVIKAFHIGNEDYQYSYEGLADRPEGSLIASIAQTEASTAPSGKNTLTITLANGETSAFTVYNGAGGEGAAVDASLSQSGLAADAATVGQRLSTLDTAVQQVENLFEENGTVVIPGQEDSVITVTTPDFTNLFDASQVTYGYRLNSSAAAVAEAEMCYTNLIPCPYNSVWRVQGSSWSYSSCKVFFYDGSQNLIGNKTVSVQDLGGSTTWTLTPTWDAQTLTMTAGTGTTTSTAYVRFSCNTLPENAIITVNEPITYTTSTQVVPGTEGDVVQCAYLLRDTVSVPQAVVNASAITALQTDGQQLAARLAAVETGETLLPTYVQNNVSALVQALTEHQSGGSCTVAFFTDPHFKIHGTTADSYTVETVPRALRALNAIDKQRSVDLCVCGGDLLWQDESTPKKKALDMYERICAMFSLCERPLILCKGNHDDMTLSPAEVIPDEERFVRCAKRFNRATVMDGQNAARSYGYCDINGCRVIYLNTVDVPYDQVDTYPGQHTTAVRKEQADFLIAALAGCPAGSDVLVFSHHALRPSDSMATSGSAENYLAAARGGDAVWGILKAFHTKGMYSAAASDTGVYSYGVSCNFSDAAGGQVLACVSGHMHADRSDTVDGILLVQTATANGYNALNQKAAVIDGGDYTTTVFESETETTVDYITVNKADGKLYFDRYGAGSSREFAL